MKFLKKLNIGLILAIISVIAVVIYCVRIESERDKSKDDIKKACEEFIQVADKFCVLPEQYQIISEDGSKVNLNSYISDMENELKKYTTTDKTANIQKLILSQELEKQLLNTSVITTNFNRKITKISSYDFDGNQVTVTFDTKTVTKQKYNEINTAIGEVSEKVSEKSYDSKDESITLEKKDGTWKIVSANLSYSQNSISNSTNMLL